MNKYLKKVINTTLVGAILFSTVPVSALTKKETVYTKLNSDGSVSNITVNDHLINNDKLENIDDLTDLKDIMNISGDESFTLNGNKLSFKATSNDIIYTGRTDKELPIKIDIKYYLNNEEKAVNDIIGATGKVKIVFNYRNISSCYRNVNGVNKVLYTPFVITTGMILNNEYNSNIEVTNGKAINNGNSNIIVGIATPGLADSLGLQELNNLNKITISFETTRFEMPTVYSVATPKIIDNDDLKIFDKLTSISTSVDKLQTSIDSIEQGANDLLEGITKVDVGNNAIYDNLKLVTEKITELEQGSLKLEQGLETILEKLSSSESLLNNYISSESVTDMKLLIKSNTDTIEKLKATNKNLKDTYDLFGLSNLTNEMIMALDATTYSRLGLTLTPEEITVKNLQLIVVKATYENSYESNTKLITLLEKDNEALTTTLQTLNDASNNITKLMTTLTVALNDAKEGSKKIVDGTENLKEGMELLTSNSKTLALGTDNLLNGGKKLTLGISDFNTKGINELSKYANKINNMAATSKELVKLSQNYGTFTMNNNKTNSETKFIMTIPAISYVEEVPTSEPTKEKVTLIDRFKNLFN